MEGATKTLLEAKEKEIEEMEAALIKAKRDRISLMEKDEIEIHFTTEAGGRKKLKLTSLDKVIEDAPHNKEFVVRIFKPTIFPTVKCEKCGVFGRYNMWRSQYASNPSEARAGFLCHACLSKDSERCLQIYPGDRCKCLGGKFHDPECDSIWYPCVTDNVDPTQLIPINKLRQYELHLRGLFSNTKAKPE